MTNVRFRDDNDRAHFFGSSALTILFFAILLADTSLSGWECFFFAFLASFTCGLLLETLTQFTQPPDAECWKKFPNIARMIFSGSPWDHRDVELNALGALVFYPVIIAIGAAFARRYVTRLKTQDQSPGIECVVCGRKKADDDGRKWFTLSHGKELFYACPRDFPLYASEDEKKRRLQTILNAVAKKRKEAERSKNPPASIKEFKIDEVVETLQKMRPEAGNAPVWIAYRQNLNVNIRNLEMVRLEKDPAFPERIIILIHPYI